MAAILTLFEYFRASFSAGSLLAPRLSRSCRSLRLCCRMSGAHAAIADWGPQRGGPPLLQQVQRALGLFRADFAAVEASEDVADVVEVTAMQLTDIGAQEFAVT